eukprot:TRINITY_DN22953_c1_g1_i4.p2 TRINITY_DN22953_c1_g1~~TRINITY_DN22953_c1_g1_i4.p2  ORF type:complete len:175 (-),score=0.41 TRINITY_DN22953_c1_g1_i4:469-993(-)
MQYISTPCSLAFRDQNHHHHFGIFLFLKWLPHNNFESSVFVCFLVLEICGCFYYYLMYEIFSVKIMGIFGTNLSGNVRYRMCLDNFFKIKQIKKMVYSLLLENRFFFHSVQVKNFEEKCHHQFQVQFIVLVYQSIQKKKQKKSKKNYYFLYFKFPLEFVKKNQVCGIQLQKNQW